MKSIDGPLKDLLRRLTGPRALKEYEAFQKWQEVVGKKISEISEPVRILSGVLYVKVNDHVWRNELMMMSGDLVDKYQVLMGEKVIKEIKFI
jgi:predicted nucleic acid-binding Zn ribbon protein